MAHYLYCKGYIFIVYHHLLERTPIPRERHRLRTFGLYNTSDTNYLSRDWSQFIKYLGSLRYNSDFSFSNLE